MKQFSRMAGFADAMLHGGRIRQVGAICYRTGAIGLEVLLITTRDTGRWTIPKGWPIGGKASHRAAEQEAFEEAGAKGRVSRTIFGRYAYVKVLSTHMRVDAVVDVHLLEVRRMAPRFPERGQRKQAWLSPQEAALRVKEPSLKRLLLRLPGQSRLK
ncbi:NUDIX hydrolase [Rhizobium sp. Root708]|uniref:NUDIX hydrolase n=1 Tax=Rhizobium sp. Root708 TaxID=1736592 RepID=UPI001FCD3E1B|nr:NUDIX hydrolase [Rhizobium sp. Root708]